MSRYIDLDQIEFLKADGNKKFNQGVDCCINRLLKAEPIEVISLDRVKKAREEMYKASHADADGWETVIDLEKAFEILDKLIERED